MAEKKLAEQYKDLLIASAQKQLLYIEKEMDMLDMTGEQIKDVINRRKSLEESLDKYTNSDAEEILNTDIASEKEKLIKMIEDLKVRKDDTPSRVKKQYKKEYEDLLARSDDEIALSLIESEKYFLEVGIERGFKSTIYNLRVQSLFDSMNLNAAEQEALISRLNPEKITSLTKEEFSNIEIDHLVDNVSGENISTDNSDEMGD
ncbi:MAG: hypothetical protein E7361_01705 [Clostridiales bacterium]|nr:hypothetical protein [Clostridiales bacterium]